MFLDATDSNSYSGSGDQWTDLSGNGNHGIVSQSASGPNEAYIPKGRESDRDATGFFINKSNDGWFDFTASGSEQTPDGTVSYATHGDVETSTNAVTMEAWYRPKRLSLGENYSIMWKPHDEPHYGYWPTIALQISGFSPNFSASFIPKIACGNSGSSSGTLPIS